MFPYLEYSNNEHEHRRQLKITEQAMQGIEDCTNKIFERIAKEEEQKAKQITEEIRNQTIPLFLFLIYLP